MSLANPNSRLFYKGGKQIWWGLKHNLVSLSMTGKMQQFLDKKTSKKLNHFHYRLRSTFTFWVEYYAEWIKKHFHVNTATPSPLPLPKNPDHRGGWVNIWGGGRSHKISPHFHIPDMGAKDKNMLKFPLKKINLKHTGRFPSKCQGWILTTS